MSKKTVLVFGGGVAGLSVAHELTEGSRANHFDVTVIEPSNQTYGGKARSDRVDGDPLAANRFPGEHGFRFFPTFYRHVTDTMSRIPSGFGGLGRVSVADHLVPAGKRMLARNNAPPLVLPGPADLARPDTLVPFLESIGGSGIQRWEYLYFAYKLLGLAVTPKDQRLVDHQTQSWWQYIRSTNTAHSRDYEHYLAGGLTRTLVAAKPTEINAKTGGDVLLRMLVDSGLNIGLGSGLAPGLRAATDRILDGPTTDVWIDPWVAELRRRGVKFEPGTLESLQSDPVGGVAGATVLRGGLSVPLTADYYVAALPVEKMALVLQASPQVEARAGLARVRTELATDVRNMVGMQFYLDRPLAGIDHDMGHMIYADSPWALTGICQSHFWRPRCDDLTGFGAGNVRTVWSTILSDWESPYPVAGGLPASACDRAQLRQKTIEQLQEGLNGDGTTRFSAGTVLSHYLDGSITPGPQAPGGVATNTQPLLVNKPDRWQIRPEAAPAAAVPNLLLAADYVRTNADLATMEAANEAARHAVNEILRQSGVGPLSEIHELYFPEVLGPLGAEVVQAIQLVRAQLLAALPAGVI